MKIKKSPHIILIMAGFLFLSVSCKKQNRCDCFKTRGETVLERRSLSSFNALRVFDKIDVYYTQDTSVTSPYLEVRTGKHLVSNITTEVIGGELQIRNNNKCNFVRGEHNDVTIYITAPYIKYFTQDGVGNIFGTNTVKQDSVYCNIINSGDIHLLLDILGIKTHTHGIGDIYLAGRTNSFFSNIQGQGFVNAGGLSTGYCYLYFKSNGEAHLDVTGQLDGEVASTGTIYYTGNPTVVNVKMSGTGKLIKY